MRTKLTESSASNTDSLEVALIWLFTKELYPVNEKTIYYISLELILLIDQ